MEGKPWEVVAGQRPRGFARFTAKELDVTIYKSAILAILANSSVGYNSNQTLLNSDKMNPILRIRPLRATKPLTSIYRTTPFSRRYAHSSYGAEGEGEDQPPKDKKDDSPTRNIEHPGPPPPNVSQSSDSKSNSPTSSFSPEITRQPSPKNTETEDLPLHTRPSNDAHPTLTDGRPSPLMDDEGNVKDDVPKDVKQHNEDMQERHDRSFNQIADEGTLHKGFGSGKK